MPSHACLHRQASLSYPATTRGIPGWSPLTNHSLQKLKPEQCRRIICKGRNNCNLPGDNCQVVSASEFCSHTTVTYQSLTSPARALGPVDIQEFNEPELALMVCMLTSRLVIHKFNISLKRKKLLPQHMMRMQELGRDYKRFCSFWRVARARVNLTSLTCFKEVSVASARCAAINAQHETSRSLPPKWQRYRLAPLVRQRQTCGGCYGSALREKAEHCYIAEIAGIEPANVYKRTHLARPDPISPVTDRCIAFCYTYLFSRFRT